MVNLSETERGVRVVLGIVLALVAVFVGPAASTVLRWIVALVAVLMLVTATTGNCPVYRALGKSPHQS